MPRREEEVKWLAAQKQRQSLWHEIRAKAPNPDPYSPESTLFFLEACLVKGIKLDEFEQEDYERLKALEKDRKVESLQPIL